MGRFIQVGNLPDSIDNLALRELFEPYGIVSIATVARHFETGRSTGVGCVEMASSAAGAAAIAALHHHKRSGRVLSVCWSNYPTNWIVDQQDMFGPVG